MESSPLVVEIYETEATGAGYRVYFGRIKAQAIVTLWAGEKSTQQQDIEKAQQY